jgi:hypothetical protein
MTYPAASVLDAPMAFQEQIGNLWRDLRPRNRATRFRFRPVGYKAELVEEFAGLAFLAPSLIAEVTPLAMFWHSHFSVWHMSAMMFGAWAVVWLLTWIIATPLCHASRQSSLQITGISRRAPQILSALSMSASFHLPRQ